MLVVYSTAHISQQFVLNRTKQSTGVINNHILGSEMVNTGAIDNLILESEDNWDFLEGEDRWDLEVDLMPNWTQKLLTLVVAFLVLIFLTLSRF